MRRVCEVVLFFLVLSIAAHAGSPDLDQYLRDHYLGKAFVLRGFSAGDHLVFGESGELNKGSVSEDWTANGFVTVSHVRLSRGWVSIEARRLLVIVEDKEFRLRLAIKPGPPNRDRKPVLVKIEADLGIKDSSPEQIERALSKIFLTAKDNFSELVADYWKPCVPRALSGRDKFCHFSSEILNVPGVIPAAESNAALSSSPPPDSSPSDSVVNTIDPNKPAVFHVGRGVKPPRLLEHHEPEFSDPARAVKYQGTMTIGLIVDKQGIPQKLRILSPLGCGLDLKAVQAVSAWRFQPAEKDGEPVGVEIAVEVDFHLY